MLLLYSSPEQYISGVQPAGQHEPHKHLDPRRKTYTVMINGLCKEGLLDEALALKFKMEKNGSTPNIVTYEIIIRALLKNGENDQALKHVHEMISRGLIQGPISHSRSESLVLRTTQRKTQSSENLDLVESRRARCQPFKLKHVPEKSDNIYEMKIPHPWILSTDKAPKLQ
ncbi:hypothetical protein PIB30_002932 [Stylosanthes scabra]|uniref:Pentatricopeptide repeat-containing protein n=1 Tax=Stylosanthes scabra TaxID=79078 RepID=A0ABU6V4M3_9FABA|nr:hypothetical protein [Stylosanthes scabra]